MDDIVYQRVLGNALQRMSELERIAQHQLHTDPPQAEAACPNSLPATVDSCFALIGARQHSVADREFLHQKVYILQMTTR